MAILQELSGMITAIVSGAYPAFVTGGDLAAEIPVFLYHRIHPRQFEAHLFYLRKNGYESAFAEDHLMALTGLRTIRERSVVMTFDDGLADLYELAFPLLRKYKLKAIAFIIPARIGLPGTVTWDQVREMHESGLVDIQSHSMHHTAIPISPEVMDFYHPDYHFFQPWELPVESQWITGIPEGPPALGTPIFQHYSRLGDAPRYFPNPASENACARHVATAGGASFFRSRGWRRTLTRLHREAFQEGRYETAQEQREAIRRELTESKARIEKETPGKHVHHFAYPWSQVGHITKELLAECGYFSAYIGLTKHKGSQTAANGIYEFARISGDFVPCLPGKGRNSFLSVLWYKMNRRLTKGQPY